MICVPCGTPADCPPCNDVIIRMAPSGPVVGPEEVEGMTAMDWLWVVQGIEIAMVVAALAYIGSIIYRFANRKKRP